MDEILDEDILDTYPSLKTVAPFIEVMRSVRWFRMIGENPAAPVVKDAQAYADALGFPDAWPGFLGDWEEASEAAQSLDFNSPAWEAEEQLRAALTEEALSMLGEDILELVTTHIAQEMNTIIEENADEAAEYLRIDDAEFITAIKGAAVQACYTAALVTMVGAGEDHPFVRRFRLFEAGYWPIGILGNSFLIF